MREVMRIDGHRKFDKSSVQSKSTWDSLYDIVVTCCTLPEVSSLVVHSMLSSPVCFRKVVPCTSLAGNLLNLSATCSCFSKEWRRRFLQTGRNFNRLSMFMLNCTKTNHCRASKLLI